MVTIFKTMLTLGLYILLPLLQYAGSLDNGLGRTPVMGWLSWQRYRCNLDCEHDPDNCISERLYMRAADLLVSEGYAAAGYQYVVIDDCWMEKSRDQHGALVADKKRFPHGIKWLADYVHSKGLKLGIYEDFGSHTCEAVYPGSEHHLARDAATFAAWTVDMLKLDGCNSNITDMDYGYQAMGLYLNQTGRPILYSCSWPAYIVFFADFSPDYRKIAETCNMWRNYHDVHDSWSSVKQIIDFYGNDTGNFSTAAGPGHFNDPDMLIIGDFGLSYEEQRVQMALWCLLAAPLMISADLQPMPPRSKALLQNPRLIAINQDPAGVQGTRIIKERHHEVWTRPLGHENKALAFAIVNMFDGGFPEQYNITLDELGLRKVTYNITEGFTGQPIGTYGVRDEVTVRVNPSGVWLGVAWENEVQEGVEDRSDVV